MQVEQRNHPMVERNIACALRPHDVILDYKRDPWATVIGVMQSPTMPEVVAVYAALAINAEVVVLARETLDVVDVRPSAEGEDPEPIVVHRMVKRFGDVLTGDIMFRWDGSGPRFYVLEAASGGNEEGIVTTTVYNFATGETLHWENHRDTQVTVALR